MIIIGHFPPLYVKRKSSIFADFFACPVAEVGFFFLFSSLLDFFFEVAHEFPCINHMVFNPRHLIRDHMTY